MDESAPNEEVRIMPELTESTENTFCWIDLATSDLEPAKSFYQGIFGWDYEDTPAGPDGEYTMARIGSKNVCGLFTITEEQKSMSMPPTWTSYIAVKDVDAVAEKAKSLSAAVFVEPRDVADMGRLSVFADPAGGVVAVWQTKGDGGSWLINEHGALAWNELQSTDPNAARDFYTELFGWDADVQDSDGMPYTTFKIGDRPVGGMMKTMGEGLPSNWMVYFAVDDADKVATQTKEAGGEIVVPPKDIPYGRFSALNDPQGAAFSIVKLADNPPT